MNRALILEIKTDGKGARKRSKDQMSKLASCNMQYDANAFVSNYGDC